MNPTRAFILLSLLVARTAAPAQSPAFRPEDVDTKIEIGYGLAIADVQGDGKPDILLADKTQIVWYEAPKWTKHVIAEKLTIKDNVCIAARDIDGDGKCEVAVGAEWNPGDTLNSGAVFYLVPPADRTQKWEPVKFAAVEPTTHRMKWVLRGKGADGKERYDLVVVPLHGRGNKSGEGAGVKVLAYQTPANPHDEWKSEVVADDMHMTHNFHVVSPGDGKPESMLLGGKEGWCTLAFEKGWTRDWMIPSVPGAAQSGVGEIREAALNKMPIFVTIEPMHGNQLVFYTVAQAKGAGHELLPTRTVLDDKLEEGHALACGDLLGTGSDQIVVGWRGAANNRLARVGIKLFIPQANGGAWTQHLIDDNGMACEDVALSDLNGDGKLDIIAAGRRTKNVKVYWNESR